MPTRRSGTSLAPVFTILAHSPRPAGPLYAGPGVRLTLSAWLQGGTPPVSQTRARLTPSPPRLTGTRLGRPPGPPAPAPGARTTAAAPPPPLPPPGRRGRGPWRRTWPQGPRATPAPPPPAPVTRQALNLAIKSAPPPPMPAATNNHVVKCT